MKKPTIGKQEHLNQLQELAYVSAMNLILDYVSVYELLILTKLKD